MGRLDLLDQLFYPGPRVGAGNGIATWRMFGR
jgi:hypothetical protein